MEKHAPEECPRCSEFFTCKVNSISKCDCNKISLTPNETQFIRNYCEGTFGRYECLCNACLLALVAEYESTKS